LVDATIPLYAQPPRTDGLREGIERLADEYNYRLDKDGIYLTVAKELLALLTSTPAPGEQSHDPAIVRLVGEYRNTCMNAIAHIDAIACMTEKDYPTRMQDKVRRDELVMTIRKIDFVLPPPPSSRGEGENSNG